MVRNKNLQGLNTLATPTLAETFCTVRNRAELEAALQFARRQQLPVTVLGEGSNVVLGDRLPGLVVNLRSRGREVVLEDKAQATLVVAGGENWHSLVHWCLQEGYHGLENLALIPGSVGAAPIQNIGAYGVEVERFVVSVHTRDLATGKAQVLARKDCEFGYRDSIFKGELRDRTLVEQVVFRLPRGAAPQQDYPSLASYLQAREIAEASPRQVFDAVVAIRSARLPDPRKVPNAGSFFKNPVLDAGELKQVQALLPQLPCYEKSRGHFAVPAAYLIDACGIKSEAEGPVRVHPDHSLVIINPDRCSGAAIQRYAARIVQAVAAHTGIVLEQEPRSYGCL
jgi:UDP-N-acetylmuramate dehydrogenase